MTATQAEDLAAERAAFAAARAEALTLPQAPGWAPAVADISGVLGPYPCLIPEGQRRCWQLADVLFDADTADRIGRDSVALHEAEGDMAQPCVFRPDGVAEVRNYYLDYDPRTGEETRACEITEYHPDEDGRYAIGAGLWVWELYEVH